MPEPIHSRRRAVRLAFTLAAAGVVPVVLYLKGGWAISGAGDKAPCVVVHFCGRPLGHVETATAESAARVADHYATLTAAGYACLIVAAGLLVWAAVWPRARPAAGNA